MPNLHLSVINDGSHYQQRLNLAFDRINGVISEEQFEREILTIVYDQAYKEWIEMNAMHSFQERFDATIEVCDYMLRHAKEF